VAVKEVLVLMEERKYRGPIIMMILFRFILTLVFIGFLLDNFFSRGVALVAFIAAVILYLLFPKKLNAQYHRIENHFLKNLNARDIIRNKRRRSDLTPWEGHLTTFDIPRESNIAGKMLKELKLREQMGVNIAFIKRGDITINIPNRNERLFPGDEVCVIGTDSQVDQFKDYLEKNEMKLPEKTPETDIVLQQLELVNEGFIGKSIRESQIREMTNGLVVGLERKGKRILNPDSLTILEKEDILWIVGEKKLLANLVRS
jgi:CPA2 family monovalent cation:H+ antiporter-2